jgi:glucosamine--fructose-6-phosphate aminotransferase (isomerizing)
MYREIAEQVTVLSQLSSENLQVFENIKKTVYLKKPSQIVLAARGSSDNACNYFKYLAEVYIGLPVSFAAPSVISLYHGAINYKDALVIGVSQSGEALDVLMVMEHALKQGATVIAITNYEESPMAKMATFHINMLAGAELSVAATKTFTSEMFCLGKLVSVLSNNKLDNPFERIGSFVQKTLYLESDISRLAYGFFSVEECYVLSRGYLYSIALEGALKLQETTYINAKAYSIVDFYHGPFAVLDQMSNVILLIKSGAGYEESVEIARKIIASGAKLTIITDKLPLEMIGHNILVIPEVEEEVAPFVYVTALQLFCYHLALLRGINPDEPRGLKKVTLTK